MIFYSFSCNVLQYYIFQTQVNHIDQRMFDSNCSLWA